MSICRWYFATTHRTSKHTPLPIVALNTRKESFSCSFYKSLRQARDSTERKQCIHYCVVTVRKEAKEQKQSKTMGIPVNITGGSLLQPGFCPTLVKRSHDHVLEDTSSQLFEDTCTHTSSLLFEDTCTHTSSRALFSHGWGRRATVVRHSMQLSVKVITMKNICDNGYILLDAHTVFIYAGQIQHN